MKQGEKFGIGRRYVLKSVAAGGAALGLSSMFPMPAIGKTTKVEYTLAWLPTGQYAFMSVARQKFAKELGIELDVKRGYGSMAATQAIASGQFDIGSASTAGSLLSVIKGLELTLVATHGYDSSMGILVPVNGPIKGPKDLEGKMIGVTAAGGDTPFLPAYYELVGVDPSKVQTVSLDSQIIEQSVINGDVDCMVAFGMSSIPNFITQDFPVQLFPFSNVGLTFYWINTLARPDYLEKEPQLVSDIVSGLMEAQKFVMLNPDEAIASHLKQHPEIAITDNGEMFTELGAGMVNASMITKVTREHMLGYLDFDSIGEQAKLVQQYVATTEDKNAPPVKTYCSNDYAGNVTLTDAEWETARSNAQEYADILGLKI